MTEPFYPPVKARGGHGSPLVQRVAPQLTGGAEIVRRHAGHDDREPMLVELEQVLVGPHVGAIVRDKDRNVANDGDPALVRLSAQSTPLVEEHELTEDVVVDLLGELLLSSRQRLRLAIA